MDISELDDFLLSGGADETIMIWSLEDLTVKSKKQIISLGPAFDAKLDHSGNWRIVAPDDTNRIQVISSARIWTWKTRWINFSSFPIRSISTPNSVFFFFFGDEKNVFFLNLFKGILPSLAPHSF